MKKTLLRVAAALFLTTTLFAQQSKPAFEIGVSLGWNFGSYKETTFANISQDFLAPRFQLDTKIYSGNFMHKITLDYFMAKPESAMTTTSVVYKNFDPVSGETYYEGFKSSLQFHRIRVQYDLNYAVMKNEKLEFYAGGSFATNAYLQFENYPSITGLFSLGPSAAMNYKFDERNSISVYGSIPLLGFGVRPPYAGCDAELMKYAEEDFMKIFTLGKFLSVHNYQSIVLGADYKIRAGKNFSLGVGADFEYSRIAVPKERPLYFVDGNFKTFGVINF